MHVWQVRLFMPVMLLLLKTAILLPAIEKKEQSFNEV